MQRNSVSVVVVAHVSTSRPWLLEMRRERGAHAAMLYLFVFLVPILSRSEVAVQPTLVRAWVCYIVRAHLFVPFHLGVIDSRENGKRSISLYTYANYSPSPPRKTKQRSAASVFQPCSNCTRTCSEAGTATWSSKRAGFSWMRVCGHRALQLVQTLCLAKVFQCFPLFPCCAHRQMRSCADDRSSSAMLYSCSGLAASAWGGQRLCRSTYFVDDHTPQRWP